VPVVLASTAGLYVLAAQMAATKAAAAAGAAKTAAAPAADVELATASS
jgi:hypothetical protein